MYKKRFLIIFLIIALIVSVCACSIKQCKHNSKFDNSLSPFIVKSENTVQFHFIDVGQGDSVLIQNGDISILIDAGTEASGHIVYNYLTKLGIDYLDYFIGTHPHEDHIGGAASVLTAIDVGSVFLNRDSSSSYFYESFVDVLLEKNIKPVFPDMDCVYEIGKLKLKFLSPTKEFEDANNNSLVFTVQFGEVKALFTGDAERIVESDLLSRKIDLRADILKVGHHGSRNASSIGFLNDVYPSVAVIQCGKDNSYGHPHEEVLERLSKIDCTVIRCDMEGTIILTTDGKSIQRSTGEEYELSEDKGEISFDYIGNKKSKVFHVDSCPNLPSENNRIKFSSRREAIQSGYKVCGNCNP